MEKNEINKIQQDKWEGKRGEMMDDIVGLW